MNRIIKILVVLILLNLNLLSHTIEPLEIDELESYIKQGVIIIDIRDESKRKRHGIIPSSYKLTYNYFNNIKAHNKWEYNLVELIKEKKLIFVLVSQYGKKAKLLAKKLYKEDKLVNIKYLKGGFEDWKKSNKKIINY